MDDKLYNEIVCFYSASKGKYPDRITKLTPKKRNDKKSNFRQNAKKYHLVDGVLMHGASEVLVKSRLATILHAYYVNPITGGHIGRDDIFSYIVIISKGFL